MTEWFPFELDALSALFWVNALAWGYFEIRYNLWRRGQAKVLVRGSADAVTFSALTTIAICGVCWKFGWGYLYPPEYRPVFSITGTAMMIAATALRYSVALTLGRLFTKDITILSDHRIVREGPFRFVRHPAYLGTMATAVGLTFVTGSLIAIAGALPILLLVYPKRMRDEEQALVSEFGDDYRAYQAQTKKLIPFVY